MAKIDRDAARALAEAGYMPLHEYVEMFGNEAVVEPTPEASPESHLRERRQRIRGKIRALRTSLMLVKTRRARLQLRLRQLRAKGRRTGPAEDAA